MASVDCVRPVDALRSHDSSDSDRSLHILPPPPNPHEDAGLRVQTPDCEDGHITPPTGLDVFTLPPVTALKLLCAGIEALVRITGDIPPTPPPSHPTTPNMKGMQAEKEEIVRSHSYTSLKILKDRQRTPSGSSSHSNEEIDGVVFKKQPLGSPEVRPTEPYVVIGANAEPLNQQHSAITRKFYSKQPPPISLEDYLMRIQKFCPMSTAVYLATSIYIHRLAVEERAIPVTRRNSHRLLLAGLRVAMKALEDLSYPHRRFAKVGGVSETELARLEVSFCFLTNFDLRTTSEQLLDHAICLKEISAAQGAVGGYSGGLRMPLKSKRNVNVQAQDMGSKEVLAEG